MKAHIRKPEKTILIYGITAEELQQLEILTSREGIALRRVQDNQTQLTVSQLLGSAHHPAQPLHPLEGRFALLSGFEGQEHSAIDLINQAAPGVIKAVHTNHNGGWRFAELCAAILEEHLSIAAAAKKAADTH